MIEVPGVLPLLEKNREVAALKHTFPKHSLQLWSRWLNVTQVESWKKKVGSWKKKVPTLLFSLGERVELLTQICPHTPMYDNKGDWGDVCALWCLPQTLIFCPAVFSPAVPGWGGILHPLPPSWSRAAMAHCAMLRRHDCSFPSQWWLHTNRGLMSPPSIT